MKDLRTKITLNIELENCDLLSEINTISAELSLSLDQLVLFSINKLLSDIKFVNQLRFATNENST